jgi:hypothetical protein
MTSWGLDHVYNAVNEGLFELFDEPDLLGVVVFQELMKTCFHFVAGILDSELRYPVFGSDVNIKWLESVFEVLDGRLGSNARDKAGKLELDLLDNAVAVSGDL